MTERPAAYIAELNPLQVRPEPLARIQFRGIGGEALHLKPVRRPIRQELLDDVTAMNWGPVPDEHQAAGHLPQQML